MDVIQFPQMQLRNTVNLKCEFNGSVAGGNLGSFVFVKFLNNNSFIVDPNITTNLDVLPPLSQSQRNEMLSAISIVNVSGSVENISIDISAVSNRENPYEMICEWWMIPENSITSSVWTNTGKSFIIPFNGLNDTFNETINVSIPSNQKYALRVYRIWSTQFPSNNLNFDLSFSLFYQEKTRQFTAKSHSLDDVLKQMFGAGMYYFTPRPDQPSWLDYAFLSGDMVCGKEGAVMTIKPSDFLVEFCKIMAYTFYFDKNGIFQLVPLEDLINSTVHELKEIRHLQFKYSADLVFSGVDVGYNSPSIEYPLFRQQFAEKLTYMPTQNGGETLFDLVVQKLRIDYAGLLLQRYDFENKPQKGDIQKQYKDVWMVQIDRRQNPITPYVEIFDEITLLGGGYFNINLSPRRVLERWLPYMKTIFGVWLDEPTLTLSSQENTENQMRTDIGDETFFEKQDVVLLSNYSNYPEAPINYSFTPIEINFDTLGKIGDIHVFDRIKFNYDGKEYNAIVKEVSTTERLEQLEITAFLTHKIPT